MKGVITIVIRKTKNKPTEEGKTKKAIKVQTTETTPPITNIHAGFLIASLMDTIFSSTILK